MELLKEFIMGEKYVQVLWNEPENLVETYWNGFVSSEEYRNMCGKLIEVCQTRNSQKILFDRRNLKTEEPGDVTWTETEWLPLLAMLTQVRYRAIVQPSLHFIHVKEKKTYTHFSNLFRTAEFEATDEALHWLKQA